MRELFEVNSIFNKDHNYVITASAGTGKTYQIVEIVKKLVNDYKIPLEKILLVTYTEKAAGELKNRIRKAVGDKVNVDNSTIGTIHSFCQGVIEEFFISSGRPSKQVLIAEENVDVFLKQYIRTGKISDEIARLKRTILNIFTKDNPSTERIREIYIAYRENIIKESRTNIEDVIIDTLRDIILQYYLNDEEHEVLDIISLTKNYRCQGQDDYLLYSIYTSESEGDNLLVNYINDRLDGRYNPQYDVVGNYFGQSDGFVNKIATFLAFDYADKAYIQWQIEKKKHHVQTYSDMLRNVREEIVHERPLLEKLRNKYLYAIIDEFQDTNQIQWDIFKKVFVEDHNHHIVVVGDPKQSIYSFQGADLSVFYKAKNEIINNQIIKGHDCFIDSNHRSTKDMIECTNAFFGNENALRLENEPFSISKCGNSNFDVKYNGEDTKAFWIVSKENAEMVTPEEYAKIVCQQIVDFCSFLPNDNKTKLQVADEDGKYRDVSFKDIAILAKTHTEMKPIMDAMEEAGIPYQLYKDSSLFAGVECAHWIALLEAIDTNDFTNKNRNKFKNAMITVFFGYKMQALTNPKFDKDDMKEIAWFEHWRVLSYNHKWDELVEDIFCKTRISKRLNNLNELKTLGIIKQIGDYCLEYLTKTQDLSSLITTLKRKLKKRDYDDEEDEENGNMVSKITDYNCVRLMTIHAAKGLEYPVVISVAGFKQPRTDSIVYSYHKPRNDNGNSDKIRVLSYSKERNPSDESVYLYREDSSEWQRVFYVAYTRAKYLMLLPKYNEPRNTIREYKFKTRSIQEFCASHGNLYQSFEDNNRSFNDLKGDVAEILSHYSSTSSDDDAHDSKEDISEKDQKDNLKELIQNKHKHVSKKHAYSSLTHQHVRIESMSESGINKETIDESDEQEDVSMPMVSGLAESEETNDSQNDKVSLVSEYDRNAKVIECEYDDSTESITLDKSFPAGSDLGQVLHDVFEVIDYTADYSITLNDEMLEGVISDKFIEYGFVVRPEWIEDVKTIVNNVLHAKLPVIHGSNKCAESIYLNTISFADRKNETEFNFNKENELLKHYFNGFVDLIFRNGEYYSIVDWKSDRLNDIDFTSYHDVKIMKDHVDDLYSIQRVLYSYCLIKWLKNFYPQLSEQEIFEKHFGGVYYVFLRGCNAGNGNGIYAQTWKDYDTLKKAYDRIVSERVDGGEDK